MQIFHCHPALKSSRQGPIVGNVPLHLHQSDLDGACGHHCTFMALMMMGILKRTQLHDLHRARSKSLSKMWGMTERSYFAGTTARQLQHLLAPYEETLDTKIHRTHLVTRMLAVLAHSGVAIVRIHNEQMSHWVLAVGVRGCDTAGEIEAKSFLILDPGHRPIALAAWNATLSITPDRLDHHAFDTPQRRMRVHIGPVLLIWRRDTDGK